MISFFCCIMEIPGWTTNCAEFPLRLDDHPSQVVNPGDHMIISWNLFINQTKRCRKVNYPITQKKQCVYLHHFTALFGVMTAVFLLLSCNDIVFCSFGAQTSKTRQVRWCRPRVRRQQRETLVVVRYDRYGSKLKTWGEMVKTYVSNWVYTQFCSILI